jgi:hypothetical protein
MDTSQVSPHLPDDDAAGGGGAPASPLGWQALDLNPMVQPTLFFQQRSMDVREIQSSVSFESPKAEDA